MNISMLKSVLPQKPGSIGTLLLLRAEGLIITFLASQSMVTHGCVSQPRARETCRPQANATCCQILCGLQAENGLYIKKNVFNVKKNIYDV